jgi:Ca2+/Na+ antiporter
MNWEILFIGILLIITIAALILLLKFTFAPPKKTTQKQHERNYRISYYILLGIVILLVLKLIYTLVTGPFSIWKLLDNFIPLAILCFLVYFLKKKSKEKIKPRKITKGMKYNPASKTYFKATKGKLQHYSEDLYKCKSCGKSYHPKVRSGSNMAHLVGTLIALVIVVTPFVVAVILGSLWLFFGSAIVLVVFMMIYVPYYLFIKKRKVVKKGAKKIKYGDIILNCPKCGSTKVIKKK